MVFQHKFFLSAIILLNTVLGHAQTTGSVHAIANDGEKEPLSGANVFWMGTTKGTTTDANGKFEIPVSRQTTKLVASFIGFNNDTIDVSEQDPPYGFVLSAGEQLEEYEVEYEKRSSEMSLIDPKNVTSVSEQELRKAACCNLSESFETNASIDASFTDAVTGTRQIKMLGLAGKYTQIMQDNIPSIRGLSTIYGLTYIPGAWVGSIQISKGVGSVVNGYESITGQINVDVKEPFDSEKLHINLYGNQAGRAEFNGIYQQYVSPRWKTNLMLHGKILKYKWDRNNDNFLDNPLEEDFVIRNNWRFIDDGPWRSEIGIGYVQQNHQAGQLSYDPNIDAAAQNAYGVSILNNRIEGFLKIGYVGEGSNSLGFQVFGTQQTMDTKFGLRPYDATNSTAYANLITQWGLWNENSLLKAGASFLYDEYDETLSGTNYSREEIVPGVFSELTVNQGNWSAIAGLRGDFHNLFGFFFTPRLHARYSLSDQTSLKLAAGRGQRTSNIIAENIGLLASSRNLNIPKDVPGAPSTYGNLQPEVAWNYGINLTHKYRLNYRDGDLAVDFYRTDFVNQIVVDVDQSPQQVYFYNLAGRSFSNSFQVETNYEFFKRTHIRLAYRWLEVRTEYMKGLRQVPLVARHRVFANLAYETKATKQDKQWKADLTVQLIGKQRLPETISNPPPYELNAYAPAFLTANAQVTRIFGKRFEVYVGAENLTNFRQSNPILASADPFGKYFDSSMVWGPIFGRMFYGGLRYVIE